MELKQAPEPGVFSPGVSSLSSVVKPRSSTVFVSVSASKLAKQVTFGPAVVRRGIKTHLGPILEWKRRFLPGGEGKAGGPGQFPEMQFSWASALALGTTLQNGGRVYLGHRPICGGADTRNYHRCWLLIKKIGRPDRKDRIAR